MVRGKNVGQIRPSPAFRLMLRQIQAKCILEHGRAPSMATMTEFLRKKTKAEEVLRNEFIRF